MKTKLIKVEDHLKAQLKDPYFKELYELERQKLDIVKCIIAYRIKNKLSQTKLAKLVGITQQHISKIERGEFSSVITLEKALLYIGYTVKIKAIPLHPKVRNRIIRLVHSRLQLQA